jgi:A/G-specific adenine glycosylase
MSSSRSSEPCAAADGDFAARLLRWFDQHGRHDLPWQQPREPYRVWLAEVMLQQTQVGTVIPYFERFLTRFPDVAGLAAAPIDEVLRLWAGLGYYARARNLHRAAQQIVTRHGGEFPREIEAVRALPGLGRSTAAAILAQSFGQRHAILDGNVKRVLARQAAIAGWPGEPRVAQQLWAVSERLLPQERLADYTQAIMDLGAGLCRAVRPQCERCPVSAGCAALAQNRVADFPAPRPRRVQPLRRAQLLLIEDARAALLFERRPPAGIWGGLWCPPVAEQGLDPAALLRERYGLEADVLAPLPALRHGFTHFVLELQPLRLRARALPHALREPDQCRWIKIEARATLALPAPIAALFNRLQPPVF